MELWQIIREAYPELTDEDFGTKGSILLQDDSDGNGAYIREWNYSKPIPKGLKLGK
jgi:XkdW protein